MLYCLACHNSFHESERETYKEPYGERKSCCPHCGADNFTNAKLCAECLEWLSEEEIDDNYGLCFECAQRVKTKFKLFLNELSDAERVFLDELLEREGTP
jgi:hypothetical protein